MGRLPTDEELSRWNPHNGGLSPHDDLLNPESRTEMANAKRFVERHGEVIRYVPEWRKFVVWDGRCWPTDTGCTIERMAKDVATEVWEVTASMLPNCDRAEVAPLVSFAKSTASARGVQSTIELVRSEPGIPITPDQLDALPWLLNCQNATVDLQTGRAREHRKADYLTKLSPVVFDQHAQCPTWERFLGEVQEGNEVMIRYLQQLVGYWITGSVREHILPIFYGVGANGKSVFLNTVQAMLGPDYAMTGPPDLLMAKRTETHPTELADLFGRRFVSCIEIEAGRRLAESLVKALTGGDRLRARRMREDFWEFQPSAKYAIGANHRPIIRGTDNGIWRRLRAIHFGVVFPPEKQDKSLPDKLLRELPGILNWAIRGCIDWQKNGLVEPDAVNLATDEYRGESDVLGDFIDECCLVEDSQRVAGGRLYEAYAAWCKVNGHEPFNNTVFGRQLTERGYPARKASGTKVRDGIGLKLSGEF
jgi:putative DNA primase/helicase